MSNEVLRDPIRMPMLPLRGLSIFPGMLLTCDVERVGSVAAINAANRGSGNNFTVFSCTQNNKYT